MLNRYRDNLCTSGLQFSFKSGHSTVMCSLALKVTVNYYWNRHSNVHVAHIDASKAFDIVRYYLLLELLYKQKLPHIMIRTIMDMYECQESRVVWNNEYGEYFTSTNGVYQRGIISPLMFTVYMDKLIKELKASGIGCLIG